MKIQHNSKAYRELLRSEAFLEDVKARANRVAAAAGRGFEATAQQGRNRARASVRTTTAEAAKRNSRDQTLLRALEAGRD